MGTPPTFSLVKKYPGDIYEMFIPFLGNWEDNGTPLPHPFCTPRHRHRAQPAAHADRLRDERRCYFFFPDDFPPVILASICNSSRSMSSDKICFSSDDVPFHNKCCQLLEVIAHHRREDTGTLSEMPCRIDLPLYCNKSNLGRKNLKTNYQ